MKNILMKNAVLKKVSPPVLRYVGYMKDKLEVDKNLMNKFVHVISIALILSM